ncbi:hypothetical protein [Streptomyces sp. RP5T]|uniref:hypothetical protein n=1 Tax=Streptomyces sp. RP5T TaxID=2490848 RepID=UPI000F64E4F6|nr:hypothetical protein [Streptomyces sp. RP5T]RRR84836.1 hypothetical protein EHS43_10270 [Streptomyces sp. RP5T]
MKEFLDTVAAEPKPDFWYGLPHGYLQLDLQPSPEGIQEVARQIRTLPDDVRDRADQVFRLYAFVLTMLRSQDVMGCALGMHPDEHGGATLSVLTVSTVPTSGANPDAVLLQMMGTGADNGIVPVELPVGTGYLLETERTTVAPTAPPEGQEGPGLGTVWQGTVAIPVPRTSSIITVQLVTASVELADDYRGVLLGIARTVTFDDPAAPEPDPVGDVPGPYGRSPFG